MVDVLLRLTALTYRHFSIGWASDDGEEVCSERVESGILVARFVRLNQYGYGEKSIALGVVDPHLLFCGLTISVLRPLSWGVRGVDEDRRFLPKISIPGFRLAPSLVLSFGPVEGWFVCA